MARSFLIGDWETRLREFGYAKDPRMPGALCKNAGPRTLSIGKWKPNRAPEGGVGISLSICKPHLGGWSVILQGSLRKNAEPIISIAQGDVWQPDDANSALDATIKYGIHWLAEYSRPRRLIEYYEACLREGIRGEKVKLPPMVKTISFGPNPAETVRRPLIFNWYLAELYSELGDNQTSRRYAECYLTTLPDHRSYEQEREQILKFIARTSHPKKLS